MQQRPPLPQPESATPPFPMVMQEGWWHSHHCFNLTTGNGDADEVGIGGDGLGIDSMGIVTEHCMQHCGDLLKPLSAVEHINYNSFQYRKEKRMYFQLGKF